MYLHKADSDSVSTNGSHDLQNTGQSNQTASDNLTLPLFLMSPVINLLQIFMDQQLMSNAYIKNEHWTFFAKQNRKEKK